jgi:hypothetical protein
MPFIMRGGFHQAAGPVYSMDHHWSFSETAFGPLVDSIAGANLTAKMGQALHFDGTDDIAYGAAGGWSDVISANKGTVGAWVTPDSFLQLQAAIGGYIARPILLGFGTGGEITVRIRIEDEAGANDRYLTFESDTVVATAGEPIHISADIDATKQSVIMYVDGDPVDSSLTIGTWLGTSILITGSANDSYKRITLGGGYSSGDGYPGTSAELIGSISSAFVTELSLKSADIKILRDYPSASQASAILGTNGHFLRCDEGTGTTLTALHGDNLTLSPVDPLMWSNGAEQEDIPQKAIYEGDPGIYWDDAEQSLLTTQKTIGAPASPSITYDFWIKAEDGQTITGQTITRAISYDGNSDKEGFRCWTNSTDSILVYALYDGGSVNGSITEATHNNEWVHLFITIDAVASTCMAYYGKASASELTLLFEDTTADRWAGITATRYLLLGHSTYRCKNLGLDDLREHDSAHILNQMNDYHNFQRGKYA